MDEWNVATGNDDDDLSRQWGSVTAEERSVALALSAAAYPAASSSPNIPSTQTTTEVSSKLDILQQAGFALYNPQLIQKQCKAIRYPSYAPATQVKKTAESIHDAETHLNEQKRDAITANEVFNIIRNIQDPEHPLTLEQLNVVRLELIDVVDLKGGDDEGEIEEDGYVPKKKFSTVHVEFT